MKSVRMMYHNIATMSDVILTYEYLIFQIISCTMMYAFDTTFIPLAIHLL